MIGKKPGAPLQANIDDIILQQKEMKPEEALKNQLMNMFQQNPNQFSPTKQ